LIPRVFTQCLVRPGDLTPSAPHMKIVGTFNPAAIETDGGVALIVRVAEAPIERRAGFVASPRVAESGQIVVDWLAECDTDTSDPRELRHRPTNCARLRFISYLKVLHSRDGRSIDGLDGPVIWPEGEYEEYGIEDPRLTFLDGTYWFTYVAVSRHGVCTCLMTSRDLQRFDRRGVAFCPENKDVVLFPERIDGHAIALHRPVPALRFQPPEIWIARSPDLVHWGAHRQLFGGGDDWERNRIGGGTPPLRTPRGWLTLYHGSERLPDRPGAGTYTAGALLLDLHEPNRLIARTPEPILRPVEPFEKHGFVPNVVFPTAVVERGDLLHVYCGAADENTTVVGLRREQVLRSLETCA